MEVCEDKVGSSRVPPILVSSSSAMTCNFSGIKTSPLGVRADSDCLMLHDKIALSRFVEQHELCSPQINGGEQFSDSQAVRIRIGFQRDALVTDKTDKARVGAGYERIESSVTALQREHSPNVATVGTLCCQ